MLMLWDFSKGRPYKVVDFGINTLLCLYKVLHDITWLSKLKSLGFFFIFDICNVSKSSHLLSLLFLKSFSKRKLLGNWVFWLCSKAIPTIVTLDIASTADKKILGLFYKWNKTWKCCLVTSSYRECKSQASRFLKKQETIKLGSLILGYMRLACICFGNNWTGCHLVQHDPFAIFVFLVLELKLGTIFYMEPFSFIYFCKRAHSENW